ENVPVGLSYKHIHDWVINNDFFKKTINIDGANFCSPEYLIMLKLRRNYCRISEGKKLMGKDYMDIISLFASKNEINLDEIKDLININISDNVNKLKEIILPLKKYIKQAKESELKVNKLIEFF
ncbi:MAG: hypothetical protein PHN56_02465, partial [Candidatus Nanoarchaeia archaeon]|nr:hypothetical protein [Candidatus Nanoarchaeia archaeon]